MDRPASAAVPGADFPQVHFLLGWFASGRPETGEKPVPSSIFASGNRGIAAGRQTPQTWRVSVCDTVGLLSLDLLHYFSVGPVPTPHRSGTGDTWGVLDFVSCRSLPASSPTEDEVYPLRSGSDSRESEAIA